MQKQREHTARPAVEVVYCPKCEDRPMLLVAVKQLLFASGAEECHYRCQACGAQDLRILGQGRQ